MADLTTNSSGALKGRPPSKSDKGKSEGVSKNSSKNDSKNLSIG